MIKADSYIIDIKTYSHLNNRNVSLRSADGTLSVFTFDKFTELVDYHNDYVLDHHFAKSWNKYEKAESFSSMVLEKAEFSEILKTIGLTEDLYGVFCRQTIYMRTSYGYLSTVEGKC